MTRTSSPRVTEASSASHVGHEVSASSSARVVKLAWFWGYFVTTRTRPLKVSAM